VAQPLALLLGKFDKFEQKLAFGLGQDANSSLEVADQDSMFRVGAFQCASPARF